MLLPLQSAPVLRMTSTTKITSTNLVNPSGCPWYKAIACGAAVAACAGVCYASGFTACASCFAALGQSSCIDCL